MGIVIMALKPLACESTAWRGRYIVSGELLSCGRFRYTRSRSVRCLFRRSDDRNRHYLPTRTDSHTATNKEPQEIIPEINNHPRDQQSTSRSTTNPEINNQPRDQQPTPKIPRPSNTSPNPPTPQCYTSKQHRECRTIGRQLVLPNGSLIGRDIVVARPSDTSRRVVRSGGRGIQLVCCDPKHSLHALHPRPLFPGPSKLTRANHRSVKEHAGHMTQRRLDGSVRVTPTGCPGDFPVQDVKNVVPQCYDHRGDIQLFASLSVVASGAGDDVSRVLGGGDLFQGGVDTNGFQIEQFDTRDVRDSGVNVAGQAKVNE